MVNNADLPRVTVDPDSFAVHVNGELVEPAPVEELPMAQRYFFV
jgi:urease subunit alpha